MDNVVAGQQQQRRLLVVDHVYRVLQKLVGDVAKALGHARIDVDVTQLGEPDAVKLIGKIGDRHFNVLDA